MEEWKSLQEEFDRSPVKTTQAGKKLTTTAAVNEIVNNIMNVIALNSGDVIAEMMFPKIQEKIEKEIGLIPPRIEVKTDTQTKIIEGVTHEMFKVVLDCVANNVPVYLTGPAGSGKNVICKQVAEALGLSFYFTNCVTQEYKLTGFIDANGNYQKTQFFDAFTKGGLFFLDEMDASVPETLVNLNAAIANRYFDFPVGRLDAHPDFRVIAAGNTFGRGADINYTGRYALDGASMNRFAVVKIEYSPAIEKNLSGGDNELLDFVRAFRTATEKACVECICSYRTIEYITKLRDKITEKPMLLSMTLTKGMDQDTRNMVYSNLKEIAGMEANAWAKAFAKI